MMESDADNPRVIPCKKHQKVINANDEVFAVAA